MLTAIIGGVLILAIMLEVANERIRRSHKQKIDNMLNKQDEAWKQDLEEEQRKKKQFETEVEDIRKKWKNHTLYHEVISLCKSEVLLFYTAVTQKENNKYTQYNHYGSVNREFCKCITLSPCNIGVEGDIQISFSSLGYQDLTVEQYLALTLAIGDGLREHFKDYPDVLIEAYYYKSYEDGWRNEVRIGVIEKPSTSLKKVHL